MNDEVLAARPAFVIYSFVTGSSSVRCVFFIVSLHFVSGSRRPDSVSVASPLSGAARSNDISTRRDKQQHLECRVNTRAHTVKSVSHTARETCAINEQSSIMNQCRLSLRPTWRAAASCHVSLCRVSNSIPSGIKGCFALPNLYR